MALSSTLSDLEFTGNASTVTAYALTGLRYDAGTWLQVSQVDADGAVTALTEGTHYTLGGDGTAGTGTLTSTSGNAIPATDTLRVRRIAPATQSEDLEQAQPLDPEGVEGQLDKMAMATVDTRRQIAELEERSIRVPDGETLTELDAAADRAGKVACFHATTGDLQPRTPAQLFALTNGGLDLGIGTVTTLAPGASATATITGTAPDLLLNLGIPEGDPGEVADTDLTWLNVKDYGAVGNGVADDTSAIQDAIDAAVASARVKTVYFPVGDYLVSGLVIEGHGIRLVGASGSEKSGSDYCRIKTNATTGYCVHVNGGYRSVQIRDLLIEGPGAATSTGRGVFVDGDPLGTVDAADQFLMSDVYIKGFGTGLYLKSVDLSTFTNVVSVRNRVQCETIGNCNSLFFSGGGFANSDSAYPNAVGFIARGGRGVVIGPCDWGGPYMTKCFDMQTGGPYTIMGGQMEYFGAAGESAICNQYPAGRLNVIGVNVFEFGTPGTKYSVNTHTNNTGANYTSIRDCSLGVVSSTGAAIKTDQYAAETYTSGIQGLKIDHWNSAVPNTLSKTTVVSNSGFEMRGTDNIVAAAGSHGRVYWFQAGGTPADVLKAVYRRPDGYDAANLLDWSNFKKPLVWSATSGTLAINQSYTVTAGTLASLTMPAAASLGDRIQVIGRGAGGWKIVQRADQTIRFGSSVSTTGVTGGVQSTNQYDTVELVCVDTSIGAGHWQVVSSVGSAATY